MAEREGFDAQDRPPCNTLKLLQGDQKGQGKLEQFVGTMLEQARKMNSVRAPRKSAPT